MIMKNKLIKDYKIKKLNPNKTYIIQIGVGNKSVDEVDAMLKAMKDTLQQYDIKAILVPKLNNKSSIKIKKKIY